ncbi:DegT/DnrJ/EryC1/StrS family aminotransferase [Demequina lutea]|uniref:dTDP-4-amino-4,6-dideoxygalactose transaminase n=1 Tax=Demequina lutea TaxID=431489 RepID=A0A7Z0CGP2_9MICO|nr:DegT/DnrJ/EryC1/StrS family aminotransferase [Demequina lutea]NYI39914.1 dTDP-4-amino-4,6-dideoxygalactose transaminase [Demequina lutea]
MSGARVTGDSGAPRDSRLGGTQGVADRLAALTGTEAADWHVVFKARYGMLETFAAIAEHTSRRSVVSQLLTCATAVDPILVAGLRPTYAEVSPDSLSIDPDRLAVGDDVAAVVIQHTFGIVDDAASQRVAAAARAAGALVLEDSAHCVGRMARGVDGAPIADVAFHSFGVEKMLPTMFGGAVWVNPAMEHEALRLAIVGRLTSLDRPGWRLRCAARTYRYQLAVLNRVPRQIGRPLRSLLVKVGSFDPPVADSETEGRLAYRSAAATGWIHAGVAAALGRLRASEELRANAVAAYVEEFGDRVEIPASATMGQPLVRFPFLVPPGVDPEVVIAGLRATGVVEGRWYRPALFPGASDPAVYGYVPGAAAHAVTEGVIARIVNLPTSVEPDQARRTARHALELIDSSRVGRT